MVWSKRRTLFFFLSFLSLLSGLVYLFKGLIVAFTCFLPISFQTLTCKQVHMLTHNTKVSRHTHSHMTCWIHWISYLGYLSMSVKTILQWFLSPPLTRVPSLPHSTQFPKCTALSRTSVPMYMSFPLSGMPSLLWGTINSYSPSAKSSMPLGKNYASSPVPQMSSIFFFHHTHHRVLWVLIYLSFLIRLWALGGHPLSWDQLCPSAGIKVESEVVLLKWLLPGSFSHP